jgi:hypothetical protein
MKAGDQVRVYPRGEESKAATGEIVLVSNNGNSIAISFGEAHVPFMTGSTGMAIHLEHGKMFLALRDVDGWRDLFAAGGRYEIEEVTGRR